MTWRTIITSEKSLDQFLQEKNTRGGRGVPARPAEVEKSLLLREGEMINQIG